MGNSSQAELLTFPSSVTILPCCVWSVNGNGSSTSGKFQGQYSKGRYLPIGLCNRNDVIRRKNRARCALNKEILDLLNEESISEVHSGSTSL